MTVRFVKEGPDDKYKIISFIAGISIVIVVCYYFILIPQQVQISHLQTACEEKVQYLKEIEAFVNKYPDIAAYERELRSKQARVDQLLPNTPQVSAFILVIEQAARNSGLQLTQISPSPVIYQPGYRAIPLKLAVAGDYYQTLAFLKKIEQLSRFTSTVDMLMQARSGILSSSFTILIYCYGSGQTAAQEQNQQPAQVP